MGCAKGALSENCDSSRVIWLQHAISKNQECLPEVIERVVEVQDKICWTTASISAIVSEEAKDGLVGIDRFEGHIAAARRGGALFCSCMNFYSLWQIETSWPLAQQNFLRVPLEDWEVGHSKVNHGGAVNVAMGGCGGGEGVANTRSKDDMW